ncbi:MAG: Crp/Fnr family transcriptional regulator [Pseudomonadota bacterium]
MLNIQPQLLAPRFNRLVGSLSRDDVNLLVPHLTSVNLVGGQCISTLSAGAAIVCFPLTLVASVAEVLADGSRFDIGLVGSEGVLGWPAVLGGAAALEKGNAQMTGGTAFVVPADVLVDLCTRSRTLHDSILRFVQSFAVQMSHTIVANLRDGIDRRLARWLLMLHDRVDGDGLPVTHGELAAALNIRRASVTDTLHVLEGDHVLRCTRGQVVVRDRAALVAIAGDSYGPAEARYRALIGPFGKG